VDSDGSVSVRPDSPVRATKRRDFSSVRLLPTRPSKDNRHRFDNARFLKRIVNHGLANVRSNFRRVTPSLGPTSGLEVAKHYFCLTYG